MTQTSPTPIPVFVELPHHYGGLVEGQDYAWLPIPYVQLVEPVRATVTVEAYVEPTDWDTVAQLYGTAPSPIASVLLHHPDKSRPCTARVLSEDLKGRWEEPAEIRDQVLGREVWAPGKTWSQLAAERHSFVLLQREMARRLTDLDIPRAQLHYALKGGTSSTFGRQAEADLHLNLEELETLLDLAELGNFRNDR